MTKPPWMKENPSDDYLRGMKDVLDWIVKEYEKSFIQMKKQIRGLKVGEKK